MGPDRSDALKAIQRLGRVGALPTLVRGALPLAALQELLAEALPPDAREEMPGEIWASLAAGMAVESEVFAASLAERLHDHLAWDEPPGVLDDWWRLVVERPLEALWMAALSDRRDVRDEFEHIAGHCVDNFRRSPEETPPSWEFLEGVLGVQAQTVKALAEAERRAAEAERRAEAARQRQEELRGGLKRVRRENAELRAALARAERKGEPPSPVRPAEPEQLERLERRARKLEKERTHLLRELQRQSSVPDAEQEAASAEPPPPAAGGEPFRDAAGEDAPLQEDPEPRRRLLRFILRKLLKKSKIGAAHTHEDNLYRGLPDHQKGLAKQVVELLYREGYLIPKPTVSDPHVSLAAERAGEARDIVAGRIDNPRLAEFASARGESARAGR